MSAGGLHRQSVAVAAGKGVSMSGKPEGVRAASGRVSPTAADTKSRSTNVWRLLESKSDFVEGMEQARQEHDRGEFRPFVRKTPRAKR
jgi:hypothetical protein